MHFDAFDRYHEKESPLHRLDPRVKTIVTIIFIVSNALLPDGAWLAFAAAWLFLLGMNLTNAQVYKICVKLKPVTLHGRKLQLFQKALCLSPFNWVSIFSNVI